LKTQRQLHNFIRGCDSVPGAWTRLNGQKVALFGSSLWKRFEVPGNAREVDADGAPSGKVWTYDKGLLFKTDDGRYVSVENVKIDDGRMIQANRFGTDLDAAEERLELTAEENNLVQTLKVNDKLIIYANSIFRHLGAMFCVEWK
jgi:formyltetrahydrofolate dehydrogenase